MKKLYAWCVLIGLVALSSVAGAQPAMTPPTPPALKAALHPAGIYSFDRLEWSATPGPWFFRVFRAVDDTGRFHAMNVTDMRRYDDYLIRPGHTYHYFVVSFTWIDSALMESAHSDTASARFPSQSEHPHGVISGMVTDSVSGKPVPLVRVQFYRRSLEWPFIPEVWTDSTGQYRATLDTGTYLIRAIPWLATARAPQLEPQWYNNAGSAAQATPVAVDDSQQVTADFSLHRVVPPATATISGTVRDTAGNPLKLARVVIVRTFQDLRMEAGMGNGSPDNDEDMDIDDLGFVRGVAWAGWTDSTGSYQARLLAGRAYTTASVKKFYLPQFFMNKRSEDEANIIRLTRDTTGIDFSLSPLPVINNSVAGMVMDSTGTGIPSRIILIPKRYQKAPLVVRFTHTDSTGAFSLASVRTGVYVALAIPYGNFAPAFYKAGAFGVIRWKNADTIDVHGNVTGIAVGVVPVQSTGVASVHGTVNTTQPLLYKTSGSASTAASAPLPGSNVYLQDSQGNIVGYGLSDDNGGFTMENVPAGSFTLTLDKAGYASASMPVGVALGGFDIPVSGLNQDPENTTSVSETGGVATEFRLEQNYPNPFNPSTVIRYALPSAGQVTLKIFNVLGQEVLTLVNGYQAAGTYSAVMDGRGLASGVYFYRLEAAAHVDVKQMVFVK